MHATYRLLSIELRQQKGLLLIYGLKVQKKKDQFGDQVANTVQAAHPDKPRPEVTALAKYRTDVAVIPTSTGNQLVRSSQLTLIFLA